MFYIIHEEFSRDLYSLDNVLQSSRLSLFFFLFSLSYSNLVDHLTSFVDDGGPESFEFFHEIVLKTHDSRTVLGTPTRLTHPSLVVP